MRFKFRNRVDEDLKNKEDPVCFECGNRIFFEIKKENKIVCIRCGSSLEYFSG